jgi:transposase
MLTLPPSVKIFVATSPVDGRKSFDGLSSLVHATFGQDPLSGHLFVFLNRRRTQVRVLFFDRTGYCIFSKRLEAGTFRLVREATATGEHIVVDAGELALMLEGIDLAGARQRKRWRPEPPAPEA